MLRVGVVSRLTIDLLFRGLDHLPAPGEEIQTDGLTVSLGGGPVVIPAVLGRMGMPVKLATFLDDSRAAHLAKELLEKQGCRCWHNFYTGGWRPITVSVVLPVGTDRSIISDEDRWQVPSADVLESFFEDCDVAVLPEHPELALRLRKRGKRLVYDTSDFTTPPPKEYLALQEIVTPNLREALKITGQHLPADALRALAAQGVRFPIIKLGRDGCIILTAKGPEMIKPVTAGPCLDATGAGDCFLAGLLYGYSRGWAFADCARMGNVFGSIATTEIGAMDAEITEQRAIELYEANYGKAPGDEICVG